MNTDTTAAPGDGFLAEVPEQPLPETPAAVVDVDVLERNLLGWQAECDRLGVRNRPHVKTHKCVELARLQADLGAVGLTCQTLREAEVMAAAGLDDLLIPYNLLGATKLERLAALLRVAHVSVSVDDEALLTGVARAAQEAGRELGVLVDCDTGFARTGVATPDLAVELARAVSTREGLRFAGFLTYPVLDGTADFLRATVEQARAAGLEPEVVSTGGTPTMWRCAELVPPVTEHRAGTYVFHDRNTIAAGAATLADAALTIHATVVSRPALRRAVLDAGSKALAADPGPDRLGGLVLEAPGSHVVRLNEEHAIVELAPGEELELGQRVRVVPNHACAAVNLQEALWLERDRKPAGRWEVAARGR